MDRLVMAGTGNIRQQLSGNRTGDGIIVGAYRVMQCDR